MHPFTHSNNFTEAVRAYKYHWKLFKRLSYGPLIFGMDLIGASIIEIGLGSIVRI